MVRRADDRWLATWAGADEILVHPLDPVTAADCIAGLLRRRAAGLVPAVTDPATPVSDARTWPSLLTRLLDGEHLDVADTGWVMDRIMAGEATSAQLAGFAVALRAKGETAAEVAGLVDSMLAHAVRVSVPVRAVDIVGTGGDRANTVNISTMAAIVIAGAGAPVVKHGNRAASSKCGAADLLEGLGRRHLAAR